MKKEWSEREHLADDKIYSLVLRGDFASKRVVRSVRAYLDNNATGNWTSRVQVFGILATFYFANLTDLTMLGELIDKEALYSKLGMK